MISYRGYDAMLVFFLAFDTEDEKERFEFIYKRYKSLLLGKAYAILRDYNLAQDAVSEAFIRAYKNLGKLNDLESGRTAAFLVMITRNTSLTLLSKRKRSEPADISEFDTADDFDTEQAVVSGSSAADMLKLVDSLKEELKTPFLLRYAYDLSNKEIGRLLKISESNVGVRIHRARSKLAEMLGKGGSGYER